MWDDHQTRYVSCYAHLRVEIVTIQGFKAETVGAMGLRAVDASVLIDDGGLGE